MREKILSPDEFIEAFNWQNGTDMVLKPRRREQVTLTPLLKSVDDISKFIGKKDLLSTKTIVVSNSQQR